MHALRDNAVPFTCGEQVARELGVELIPIDSDNHVLLPQEQDWQRFTRLVDEFLQSS
jgi:Xaa-Pro aminopeptidase